MSDSVSARLARSLELPVLGVAVFLAPFLTLAHEEVFITLSDLFFVFAALLTLLCGRVPLRPLGSGTTLWLFGCSAILFGLLVSSLVNPLPARSLIIAGQYMFAYVLLIFLIAGRDEETTHWLIKVFVASTVVNNFMGLVAFYAEEDLGYDLVTGGGRLAASLLNPNANANLIALTLPFVLYLWQSGRMAWWTATLAIAVLALALICSSSVNGLIATLIGLICFLVTREFRTVLKGLVIVSCAGTVGLVVWSRNDYVLPEIFEKRVMGAVKSGELEHAGTFQSRLDLMIEAVNIVDDALLFGVGADRYQEVSVYEAPVHNVYLQLWAEGGLVALVGWLALMTIPVLGALTIYRGGHRDQFLVASLGIAVVAVFTTGAMNTAHRYGRYWVVPLVLAMTLLFSPTKAKGR